MEFNQQLLELTLYIFLLIILFIAMSILIWAMISNYYSNKKGSPFVSNDNNVIRAALRLAKTNKTDTVIDIGSGDGRVLRIAINEFNVKLAIGYEIAPLPYYVSLIKNWLFIKRNSKLKDLKLKGQISLQVFKTDIKNSDLSSATVIYIYLFPQITKTITPYLIKLLKKNKNLRIVSVSFRLNERLLRPVKVTQQFHKYFRIDSEIFLYTYESII